MTDARIPGLGTTADSIASSPVPSRLRRLAGRVGFGLAFATMGFTIAVMQTIPGAMDVIRPTTDEESLRLYNPEDDVARQVEAFINNHPLTAELRKNPDMIESRPHMKIPQAYRRQNLTGGTLLGPGRVVVPPFSWNEKDGKSAVSISYIGTDLCGHPGIVHGGFLATMLDEGMARCCFAVLPHKVGVTAKLDINYRKPAKAGTYVVLRTKTVKVEGRKAWVEGQIETLVAPGETPIILVEAAALFVSPRQAWVCWHQSPKITSVRIPS
jgi:3'-phosphoadenosine 5'-phosphosulfate synthase